VTGRADSPLAELAEEVIVCTPELERSWCHTGSYTCAVAAIASLRGEDVSWLPAAVEDALGASERAPSQAKILVAGAGRDWPTAQEAVLKLREGAWISAGAHHTEQLLHGHLAAVDESVRAYVLEGEGRAAERADDAAAALRELGYETTLVPTRHPVLDIVRFQLLALAIADARGIDPDRIHRDDPRWARARAAYR
jgi:glucosamine--fructose-6-phosphate aminotransferase (isomerizing)